MINTFLEFVDNKKKNNEGEETPITSRVNLGDGNDLPPFIICDDPNSEHYGKNRNFAPIVRAFKKGGNWGWSRDESSGEDKPVKVGGKKLYLTGGALRDHLVGKKPRNVELATNCLRGNTKIITLEHGPIELEKIINKTVTVKARDGVWRAAFVKSYGEQTLYEIRFGSKNGLSKEKSQQVVYATSNHRWFLKTGKVTENIQVGDILESALVPELDENIEAIQHGLIFGDGSGHKKRHEYANVGVSQGREYCSIRLCGDDKKYLEIFGNYNITYPPHANGDPIVHVGRKSFWKDLPFTVDPSYINSFIRGWWLADGSKTYHKNPTKKQIEISTSRPEALAWLQEYASYAGYVVTGFNIHKRKENDGSYDNGKELYSIHLAKNTERKVYSIEEYQKEIVYCVEEPQTKGFVLANGLLTGNCSPDEVYHILTQNKFEFIGDENELKGVDPSIKQYFWVKEKDKKGRPYTFGIKVRNEEFELGVFSKKGGPDLAPGTHNDDANGRDFTINSMYLVLGQDNGSNKEIHDFYGGIHHLKSGRIASVGNMEQKMKEDPIRALKYARMLSRYGNPKQSSQEEKDIIRNSAGGLSKSDPVKIMDEFMRGLNYEDIDIRNYLKTYSDLGLIGSIFPDLTLDTKFPKELRELGDKHAPIAWMLRQHEPKDLESKLSSNWKPEDLRKIVFLVKSLGMNDAMDEDTLEDLVKSYMGSGVSSRKLKQWATKLGGKSDGTVDAFIQHAQSPRIKIHTSTPDGYEEVAEEFKKLIDPFNGELQYEEIERKKKSLELQNFRALLDFHDPKMR